MKTIFDLCEPRRDVVEGRMRDEEFAADLAGVVNGKAPPEYADPVVFFRHTHPMRGLRSLRETSCKRLSGTGGEMNSVVRLDTQFPECNSIRTLAPGRERETPDRPVNRASAEPARKVPGRSGVQHRSRWAKPVVVLRIVHVALDDGYRYSLGHAVNSRPDLNLRTVRRHFANQTIRTN